MLYIFVDTVLRLHCRHLKGSDQDFQLEAFEGADAF